jgi:transposase
MMDLFLEEISVRHTGEFIVMIMDGAGWHTSRALRQPDNMQILYLPPCSPELNPVEYLRDEIREKYFSNLVFATIESLEVHLMHSLATLEQDRKRVRSITGWEWIVINLRQSRRLDKDVNRSKRLKTVSYLKVATHRTS